MTSKGDLTEFERAVLDKLVAGDHPALKLLQTQVQELRVSDREWYGTAGFATGFAVDLAAPWFGNYIHFELSDVVAHISGMQGPTIYVTFVSAGRLAWLEGTAFEEEPWPEPIVDFQLSYLAEPRHLTLPMPHFGDSDLPAAWQELYDVKPPEWYLDRPTQHRNGTWTMYVIGPPDDTRRGRFGRKWAASGKSELECVREMAKALRAISEARVPK